MLKVKISRKRWLKGADRGATYLYRPDDRKMCCLGFALRKAGHKVKDIKDIGEPAEMDQCLISSLIEKIENDGKYNINSVICSNLMTANDDEFLSDQEREVRIKKLGKKAGIEFTFVDSRTVNKNAKSNM